MCYFLLVHFEDVQNFRVFFSFLVLIIRIFVVYFRHKQDGFLAVDEQEVIEGTAKGTYTMLNTNKILYIGKS